MCGARETLVSLGQERVVPGGPRLPLYIPFHPTGCPVFTEVAWAGATPINSASHDHTSWVRENKTEREEDVETEVERREKRKYTQSKDRHEGPRPRHRETSFISHSKPGKGVRPCRKDGHTLQAQ